VPETIGFETKTAIALGQLRQALADSVPVGIVLGDAAYGDETAFRVGTADLGLRYVLGVRAGTSVWAPGTGPLSPAPWSGRGRRPAQLPRDAEHQPVTLKALALNLPARAWRSVTWREGTQGDLSSRFAVVRVRPAHRDTQRSEPWPEAWLLIEWPEGDAEPAKYWFSNLSRRTTLKRLVRIAKARWWIERDDQDLGLGHDEGRNWRGFHHHASLCIAAYGFLIAERCLFPPQQRFIRRRIETPALPAGFRLRGAAGAA
jgi:SRSO17 transposase